MSLRIPFTIKITGQLVPGIPDEEKEAVIDEEYDEPFLLEFEEYLEVAQLYRLNGLFPQLRNTLIPYTRDTSDTIFGKDNTFTRIETLYLTIPGIDSIVDYEKLTIRVFTAVFEMIEVMFEENRSFSDGNFVPGRTTIELKVTLLDEYKKNLNIREKTHVIQGIQQVPQNVARRIAEFTVGIPSNTIPLRHRVPEPLRNGRLYAPENLRPGVIQRRAAEAAAASAAGGGAQGGGGGGAQGGGRRKVRASKTRAARKRSTRRKSGTRKQK